MPARPAPTGRPIGLALAATALTLGVGTSAVWRLTGGWTSVLATPSMCPALCVGTLVLERPADGGLRPGTVVSFRPPGIAAVYTHRVVAVLPAGALLTAGDALGRPDPWRVPRQRVVGRVVAAVAGLGWLWRCLPAMAAALACFLLARQLLAPWLRPQADLLFLTLLVSVPAVLLHPFVRAEVVALRLLPHRAVVRALNTGLLPVRLRLGPGRPATVAPGHAVRLATSSPAVTLAVAPSPGVVHLWAAGCALVALAVLVRAVVRRPAGLAPRATA